MLATPPRVPQDPQPPPLTRQAGIVKRHRSRLGRMPVRVGEDAIGVTNGVTIGGLSAQGAMEPAAERARGRPIPREAPQPREAPLPRAALHPPMAARGTPPQTTWEEALL